MHLAIGQIQAAILMGLLSFWVCWLVRSNYTFYGFILTCCSALDYWVSSSMHLITGSSTDSVLSAYDSAVHISEECSNAAVAVPKAIVGAIALAGVLGTAIMIALAFCMGTDLEAIMDSSVGQPVSPSIYARSLVLNFLDQHRWRPSSLRVLDANRLWGFGQL